MFPFKFTFYQTYLAPVPRPLSLTLCPSPAPTTTILHVPSHAYLTLASCNLTVHILFLVIPHKSSSTNGIIYFRTNCFPITFLPQNPLHHYLYTHQNTSPTQPLTHSPITIPLKKSHSLTSSLILSPNPTFSPV